MARDRLRTKGRRESGNFAMLPDVVLRSPEAHSVPGEAIRLLVALAAQYNGSNNGNLSAALSVLRAYGFTSSDTVSRNLRKLEGTGLIVRTRDGMFSCGVPACALYALAWKRIDACPGKSLTVTPTDRPPRSFQAANIAKRSVRKSEQARSENRIGEAET